MTSTMLPPPAGELTIVANGRKYIAASAEHAVDLADDDGVIASANGWMRVPTGSPNQPTWPNWKTTAVMGPPARGPVGSVVDIIVNGRFYSCKVGATISVPVQDADAMTANGWKYIYPWASGTVEVLTASEMSPYGSSTIYFASVPSWLVPGMFVSDLTNPLRSTTGGSAVVSVTSDSVVVNTAFGGAGVISAITSNPTSTTIVLPDADVPIGTAVGMNIQDFGGLIPDDAIITEISSSGGATTITFSPEASDTIPDSGDDIFIGGIVAGDQIAFSNGQVRTSAASGIGSTKLSFSELPNFINNDTIEEGIYAVDVTAADAISAGTTVTGYDPVANTVTLSAAVNSPGVAANDVIAFSAP